MTKSNMKNRHPARLMDLFCQVEKRQHIAMHRATTLLAGPMERTYGFFPLEPFLPFGRLAAFGVGSRRLLFRDGPHRGAPIEMWSASFTVSGFRGATGKPLGTREKSRPVSECGLCWALVCPPTRRMPHSATRKQTAGRPAGGAAAPSECDDPVRVVHPAAGSGPRSLPSVVREQG